jgi:hypothetical protein
LLSLRDESQKQACCGPALLFGQHRGHQSVGLVTTAAGVERTASDLITTTVVFVADTLERHPCCPNAVVSDGQFSLNVAAAGGR